MNKKGFTLIEIIIVIVILGVLATLALPRLTAQVDSAEAAEAMQFFGVIKRAAISCYDGAGSFAVCTNSAELAIPIPATAKFIYTQSNPSTAATTIIWWARATRNTANYILMNLDQAGATKFATAPTGPFLGIVNKTGSTTVAVAPLIDSGNVF